MCKANSDANHTSDSHTNVIDYFGKMGADVYEFNKHIMSKFMPYYSKDCCDNSSEMRAFYIKRISYMLEELSEISNATIRNNVADIADGLIDLMYFALGTMVLMDMPIKSIWDAVHAANMTKVGGVSKRGFSGDAKKLDDFVAPNIQTILADADTLRKLSYKGGE